MDFVIVGPEKTGTGWIDAALRAQAPHALPAVTKETFYLDRLFHLGADWHAELYDGAAALRGEVSPSYFAKPQARRRLAELNPLARIVVILRDPYARMASHLLHRMRRGAGDARSANLGLDAAHWDEARQASRYAHHGQAWRDGFGEGVAFVRYEDIHGRPGELLRAIAGHVGLPWRADDAWAAEFSQHRVFESAVPTSALMARMAYFMSRRLQHMGATRLVSAVRGSGVRKLFERPGATVSTGLRQRAEAMVRAREDFQRDIDFAENVLGSDLSAWRHAMAPPTMPQAAMPQQGGANPPC
ncbi:MAG: sulfotransferase [Hyphomonadaceae bacterium]